MSVETIEASAPPSTITQRVRWSIEDGLVLTRRNLLRYIRIPTLLVFSTIQPVMFVLLFRFVFGGSIRGLPQGSGWRRT
jgi:hypothetical protein